MSGRIRLMWALMSKYWRLMIRDTKAFLFVLLFPWVSSAALQLATATDYVDSKVDSYIFLSALFCFWFMLNLGVRLIVTERELLTRELYAGLSPGAYLAAKTLLHSILALYVAGIFAISINIYWLDWHGMNSGFQALFVPDVELQPKPEAPIGCDTEECERQNKIYDHKNKLHNAWKVISALRVPEDFIFVYKPWLRFGNPAGELWFPTSGYGDWKRFALDSLEWQDHVEGFRRYPNNDFPLSLRIRQQLLQLLDGDYGLTIMGLSSLSGLTLGLLISASTRSKELAVNLVPIITIVQLVFSRDLIGKDDNFDLLSTYHLGDLVTWDFASLLSLATYSRYFDTLARILLAPVEDGRVVDGAGALTIPDLYVLIATLVLAMGGCYVVLRRWTW